MSEITFPRIGDPVDPEAANTWQAHELIRRAINAALIAAETAANDYFVVEVSLGQDGRRTTRDLCYVCDKYGAVDGPYTEANAREVARQENNAV